MRLIVCGMKHVWLYDTVAESWRSIIEQPNGYTFGVTWDKGVYFVSVRNEQGVHLAALDKNFSIGAMERVEFGKNPAPHQIIYNPKDDKLYWCMANLGVLKVRDMVSGQWSEWNPCAETTEAFIERLGPVAGHTRYPLVIKRKIIKLAETDDPDWRLSHYVNSVWFDAQNNGYVMSHNRGPSELVECNGRELLSRTRCGRACHNVWMEDDDILYCDSAHGAIKKLGSDIPLLQAHYFPRGVAWADDKRYIGMSFKGAKKAERERMNSHIVVTNPDWTTDGIIDCPFKGEIYDIRALCTDAKTHNGLEPPR